MLEVCYNKSIEDLATPEEKNDWGEAQTLTPFLTAMRLSKVVQDEFGFHYGQAVSACLHCSDMDLDEPSQFARSVMKNIIEPLKVTAESFEKPVKSVTMSPSTVQPQIE